MSYPVRTTVRANTGRRPVPSPNNRARNPAGIQPQGSSRPRTNQSYDGQTPSGAEAYGNWADEAEDLFGDFADERIPFAGDDYPPTVGSVVDQFLALSPDERQAFLQLIGGMGYQLPEERSAPGPGTRRSPAPGRLTATLSPGYTQDPTSGKIYRAQPPKERPQEWENTQNEYNNARSELADEMLANKFTYNVKTSKLLDVNNQEIPDDKIPESLVQLREKLLHAKERVKAYKKAHPEYFREEKPAGRRKLGKPVKTVPTVGFDRTRTGKERSGS